MIMILLNCSRPQTGREVNFFTCHATTAHCRELSNFQYLTPNTKRKSYRCVPFGGLRYLGISVKPKSGKKFGHPSLVTNASLFGVGAPEALVIGVVALLVLGPKGLAEVARNLGKTLRAFRPTIRELQDVAKEFKMTLEKEIGLDEDPISRNSTSISNFSTVKQKRTTQVNSKVQLVAEKSSPRISKNIQGGEASVSDISLSNELHEHKEVQDTSFATYQSTEAGAKLLQEHASVAELVTDEEYPPIAPFEGGEVSFVEASCSEDVVALVEKQDTSSSKCHNTVSKTALPQGSASRSCG